MQDTSEMVGGVCVYGGHWKMQWSWRECDIFCGSLSNCYCSFSSRKLGLMFFLVPGGLGV